VVLPFAVLRSSRSAVVNRDHRPGRLPDAGEEELVRSASDQGAWKVRRTQELRGEVVLRPKF
jgi:hypothetical protein